MHASMPNEPAPEGGRKRKRGGKEKKWKPEPVTSKRARLAVAVTHNLAVEDLQKRKASLKPGDVEELARIEQLEGLFPSY